MAATPMSDAAHFTFDQLSIGQSAEFEVIVSPDLIAAFATLSGDRSPIHTDEAAASAAGFAGRVAHGMLGGALISRLIGMYLPGAHALYLSQSLFFEKPIIEGAAVSVRGVITAKSSATRTVSMVTELWSSEEGRLLHGVALVKVLA